MLEVVVLVVVVEVTEIDVEVARVVVDDV